jgi:hypothetical protein
MEESGKWKPYGPTEKSLLWLNGEICGPLNQMGPKGGWLRMKKDV